MVVRARIRLPASPCLHPICCFRYSTTFVHASHPLIRSIRIHSCIALSSMCYICSCVALASFLRRTHLRVALIHASPSSCVAIIPVSRSLMRHLCSCVALIHTSHLFMYYAHSRVTFVHASHSFMRRTYSCIALTHASPLFMRRTHLFVALIHSPYSFHASHSFNDTFIHALYSFTYRPIYALLRISLFMNQPCSLQPPYSVLLLDIYQVVDFLARVLRYDQDGYVSRCT